MTPSTTIHFGDGFLLIEPSFPDSLLNKLKYWRRSLEWDEAKMRRVASGRYEQLYTANSRIDPVTNKYVQELITMPGFLHRVKAALRDAGYAFTVLDKRTPMPHPNYRAAFEGLYDHQKECAAVALQSGGGIIAAPTGWGKTAIMRALIAAYSHEEMCARGTPTIVVATPDKDITFKNFEDLRGMLPDRDVGLVMSGHSKFSDDVQVITLDSLHRINSDDVGVCIVDEVHAAASDARTEDLVAMKKAAKWGVSATPQGRFDGRDLVTEGIFGPIVYRRTYAEGVADGALVPISVYWVKSPEPEIGLDNYLKFVARTARYRRAVWSNPARNKAIADIMRRTPQTLQTLCIMQYLEQMNNIRPLTDASVQMVHAETSGENLLAEGYRNLEPVSVKERRKIYKLMFEEKITRIMSTYVYKQGVNFPHLEIVINAGGGGSDIVTKQIPGRESRKTTDKSKSYLVDFWHPWDQIYSEDRQMYIAGPVHADDKSREKSYTELGFNQVWVDNIEGLPFLTKGVDDAQKTSTPAGSQG